RAARYHRSSSQVMYRGIISTAKQDFCNLMCPDARARDVRTRWSFRGCDGSAIHQDNDRTPGTEKTDHVVVIGDAAASVRDVAQISAEREQLFALGSAQERKHIRVPAETIAHWCAVVGHPGGKRQLQCGF